MKRVIVIIIIILNRINSIVTVFQDRINIIIIYRWWWWWCLLLKDYNEGVTKSNPTQKCRTAKGTSKGVNIQIIKDSDITEHTTGLIF
jgi:hypothetical protein